MKTFLICLALLLLSIHLFVKLPWVQYHFNYKKKIEKLKKRLNRNNTRLFYKKLHLKELKERMAQCVNIGREDQKRATEAEDALHNMQHENSQYKNWITNNFLFQLAPGYLENVRVTGIQIFNDTFIDNEKVLAYWKGDVTEPTLEIFIIEPIAEKTIAWTLKGHKLMHCLSNLVRIERISEENKHLFEAAALIQEIDVNDVKDGNDLPVIETTVMINGEEYKHGEKVMVLWKGEESEKEEMLIVLGEAGFTFANCQVETPIEEMISINHKFEQNRETIESPKFVQNPIGDEEITPKPE